MKKLFLLFFMLTISVGIMAQKTWDRGAATNNWGDANNWNPNGVPGSGDAVTLAVIGGATTTINVNVAASCASLTFPSNNTDAVTLNINSGITLAVTGAVTIPKGSSTGTIVNTLAVGAGTLNAGSIAFTNSGTAMRHQLTISTGTVTVSGNVTVETVGDASPLISFSGAGLLQLGGALWTTSGGTLTPGTGTVEYNAAGAQTVHGFTYNILKLSGGGTKTLGGTTNVSSTLNMTSGNVALNSFTLTLGTGETDGTRGTLSWTDGFMTGAGTFKRYFSTTAVTLGNAQGLFPMGGSNHSVWVGCSPSASGSISVQHSNTTGFTAVTSFIDDGVTVDRRHNMSWTLAGGDGFTDTDAQLRIQGSGIPGIAVVADLRMILSNGIVSNTTSVDGSGTASDPIVERSGFSNTELTNTFYFGANSTDNPLPVELTSFGASIRNYSVLLNWETSTESHNYGFDVERSADKINWSKVAFVNGHGNSNSPKQYSYTDSKISSGKYYYRLKQIDTEGTFAYSKEVEVSTGELLKDFVVEQNFPNPFNPTTTIKFGFKEPVSAKVVVYNALGSEVTTLFNERTEAGKIYSIDFDGSHLASGIYYYAITGGNFKSVKKMILMK